jgi:hypothetical protein
MLNDEDDDTAVAVDPELDTEIADGDEDDEADVTAASRKPKRARSTKQAATRAAAKATARKPAKSGKNPAPAKAAAKTPRKAAKAPKKPAARKKAKAAAPPADLTGVKAGAHTLWVSEDLAGALTSKDRRKLKALLKRAEKRRKAQKKK